jgi:DinB family protein
MNAWDQAEAELNDATVRARTLVDDTPARLFTVRPALTQWSAAECVAHLSISTGMFLPVLARAIDETRKRGAGAAEDPKMDVLGRILRWFLEPPVRSRMKTKPAFVPKSTRAKGEAIAEFNSLQTQLTELLRSSRDLPIGKVKIVSPFDRRVKYNIYSAFLIVAAHQRRHLWQAEQAIAALRRAKTIN